VHYFINSGYMLLNSTDKAVNITGVNTCGITLTLLFPTGLSIFNAVHFASSHSAVFRSYNVHLFIVTRFINIKCLKYSYCYFSILSALQRGFNFRSSSYQSNLIQRNLSFIILDCILYGIQCYINYFSFYPVSAITASSFKSINVNDLLARHFIRQTRFNFNSINSTVSYKINHHKWQ
jgi:hypothetical protein